MSKPSPARYRTTNWSSYTASLCKRGSLLIWLEKDMTWLASPDGSPGRPAVFSAAAIQFCLTIKVLFKLPLRQTTGMVASLLKLAGLDWAVPDYTTLCRRQRPWLSRSRIGAPMARLTCSSIAPGSSSWAMVNGRPASMAFRAVANRCPAGDCNAIAREGAQGTSCHGYGHFGHPGGGIHPQQRW